MLNVAKPISTGNHSGAGEVNHAYPGTIECVAPANNRALASVSECGTFKANGYKIAQKAGL